MPKTAVEKRFAVLCQIVRAQHFAWRQAVTELCPDVETGKVVDRMWRLTGNDTARAYAKRIDRDAPLAPQIAESIAWSSQAMGEDAVVETVEGKDESFVRHQDCPWKDWHEKLGLLSEDRPGCDAWFQSTVDAVNEALGSNLRFETIETLPDGSDCCLRRFWVE